MFKMRANIVAMGVIGVLLLPGLAQAEQVGHASWYALHSRTASGEMMNPSEMTAAHRSLPFGTKVLVENLSNGHSVVVRINDRGPFVAGRIIDVSKAAASSLGMLGSGTAQVRVSTSGGGSPEIASSSGALVEVATATTKMGDASGDAKADSTAVVRSAKMEGVPASKPLKVAAASSKPTKVASASRSKFNKIAKASRKPAKIVIASAGKSTAKSEKRSVAGLMKSTRDLERVASRASRKTYASRSNARRAVAVASREFGKRRRDPSRGITLASSANPYGAFVRSASFVN
ncbi:septal ring lytic transglycosylase RlpA family protein [Methyloceanibacter sp.]|uniref:septal ring lytic transglycosylase RlpA family protein n=1 Tax=Methyloceanibacter sp. TaxID=1965321 RepID=UPI003D6DA2C1